MIDGNTIGKEAIMSMKRKLLVAAASATLGLVMGATVFSSVVAGAQETTTTESTSESTNESGGEAPDRTARIREALEALVTAGTITTEQADAVAAHLAEVLPHRGGHFVGRGAALATLEEAAAAIGIDVSNLRTALQDGQTIAEVATANGVDPQTVIDALVAAFNVKIDEAVANGRITAELAVEKKENALERIAALVNGEFEFRPGFWVRPNSDQDTSG
jgi:hypothetical protein